MGLSSLLGGVLNGEILLSLTTAPGSNANGSLLLGGLQGTFGFSARLNRGGPLTRVLLMLLAVLFLRMDIGRSTEAFFSSGVAGAGVWIGNCSVERIECGGTGGAGREPSPPAGKAFADGNCGTDDACDNCTDLGGDLGDTMVTNGGLAVGEVGLVELGRWIKADLGRSFRGVTGGPTALLRC